MRRERTATSKEKLHWCFYRANRALTSSVVLYLMLGVSLRAQELVRSFTRETSISAYQRSPEAFFYLGPFQEELIGSAGVQYTDNVNLTATDKISDLSYLQQLNLNTTWVISHLNQLQFTFGGELLENFYGNGRTQINFAISPDSKIEFKFEISNFKIRLYDYFSYSQNPTQDPTATDTANLNSVTNTIGAAVDEDLGIAVFSLSADYTYNDESGQNSEGVNNPTTTGTRSTFRVGPSLTFRLSPSIVYGLSAEATRSNSIHNANVNALNVGPIMNGKLTRNFEFDLSGGASFTDTKPSIAPGYYYSATVRYLLNRHWQLLFSASHDLIFTTGDDLTEENLIKIGTRLDITRTITLSLDPFVNFGDIKTVQGVAIAGTSTGNYTQFGVEANLGWKFRKRWTSSFSYNFVRRESGATFGTGTTASQNYIQNLFSLNLSYAF
jgi:hypothetical protein